MKASRSKQRSEKPMNELEQYVKLENRLVLLAWLNSLLGYGSNRELLEDTKTVAEGFAADGHSFMYHHLIARGGQVQIPAADLARYDDNIRQHLEKINRGRTERITLRYFPSLAALYTEIVLDCLFNHQEQLLADLNGFVRERNAHRLPDEAQENAGLSRIYFDRHLYLPLLVEQADKMQTIPPALKPSEAKFVRDLKAYWETEKDKALAGKEVFLLRNLSRGRGIGFFEERGFYPDFILWIVDGSGQRIVFVEPHGMLHAKAYIHDEKARLHERMPKLAREIGNRSGRRDIALDSYIISATPFDDLRRRYDDGTWDRKKFAQKHILFQERNGEYDYIKILLEEVTREEGDRIQQKEASED